MVLTPSQLCPPLRRPPDSSVCQSELPFIPVSFHSKDILGICMRSFRVALWSGGGFNWRLYVQSGVNTFMLQHIKTAEWELLHQITASSSLCWNGNGSFNKSHHQNVLSHLLLSCLCFSCYLFLSKKKRKGRNWNCSSITWLIFLLVWLLFILVNFSFFFLI